MPENQNTGLNITDSNESVKVISLAENVQGGNDALEFSSVLLDLDVQKTKKVIINLEKVKMMNSSGLGMLVSGLNTLKKNNIKMVLTNIPERIEALLEMTHLNQVFHTIPTMNEALSEYEK
jgi:anti-sigma B factor antagonist